jgi:hypothetical protein
MTPPNSRTRRSSGEGSFHYEGFTADPASGLLRLGYRLGAERFVETIRLPASRTWDGAAWQAARLVFLLAGVSYYKTAAPPVVDLGDTPVTAGEREFLRRFYTEGLGEFALRNDLDLQGLRLEGGTDPTRWQPGSAGPPASARARRPGRTGPLVPFGGGIDSIVTAELVRERVEDPALFVLSPAGARFAAIEAPAATSGLPVVRAERELDEKVLAPACYGYLTGHVPVTGILSAIAVLCAVLDGRETVVMSNERSASAANVVTEHGPVNHQWSKSLAFEDAFHDVLAASLGGRVDYFSLLRPCSELWVAERFAASTAYHHVFRSCNRAFHVDPGKRLDHWCATCDKCCFVDLVLAPFLPPDALAAVFAGREPLENRALRGRFETLLGLSPDTKPWECVGDLEECRSAAVVAAGRPDRAGNAVLEWLVHRLGTGTELARRSFVCLLSPQSVHRIPAELLPLPSRPRHPARPPRPSRPPDPRSRPPEDADAERAADPLV